MRKRVLIVTNSLLLLCLFVCSGCQKDQDDAVKGVQVKTLRSRHELQGQVAAHPHERMAAAMIFALPMKKRAESLEALVLRQGKALNDPALLSELEKCFRQASVDLVATVQKAKTGIVEVSAENFSDHALLRIRLRGKKKGRCLFVATNLQGRGRRRGAGSQAVELATFLEVIRCLTLLQSMATVQALAIDIEFQYPLGATGLGYLKDLRTKGELCVGIASLENLVPVPSDRVALVLQRSETGVSALEDAAQETLQSFVGQVFAWQDLGLDRNLDPVPAILSSHFSQERIPWIVIRAASAAANRELSAPEGRRAEIFRLREIAAIHAACGSKDDRLAVIAKDGQYRLQLAAARALVITILRTSQAFE